MGKRHGFHDAQIARDDRRAQKRQGGKKIGDEKQQTEGLELDAEAEKKPVRHQSAGHAGAEVVDESEDRHLGDEYAGGIGNLFFDLARLVLVRRWHYKRITRPTLNRMVRINSGL